MPYTRGFQQSCFYCRILVPRLSVHLERFHSDINPTKVILDGEAETTRSRNAGGSAECLADLINRFPDSYLDVADALIQNHVVVYLPLNDKYIQVVSLADVAGWKMDITTIPWNQLRLPLPKCNTRRGCILRDEHSKPAPDQDDTFPTKARSPAKVAQKTVPVIQLPMKKENQSPTPDAMTSSLLQPVVVIENNVAGPSGLARNKSLTSTRRTMTPLSTPECPVSLVPRRRSPRTQLTIPDYSTVRPPKWRRIMTTTDSSDEEEQLPAVDFDIHRPKGTGYADNPRLKWTRRTDDNPPAGTRDMDGPRPEGDKNTDGQRPAGSSNATDQRPAGTRDIEGKRPVGTRGTDDQRPAGTRQVTDERPDPIDSDTDEDEPTTSDTMRHRNEIKDAYSRHGMLVSAIKVKRMRESNAIVLRMAGCYAARKKAYNNYLGLVIKVMAFAQPEHDAEAFQWRDLTKTKVIELFAVLRTSIRLAPYSVANFVKVVRKMANISTQDEAYVRAYPFLFSNKEDILDTLTDISKGLNREISQGQNRPFIEVSYTEEISTLQRRYVLAFEAYQKSNKMTEKLLKKARGPAGSRLNVKEVLQVNSFFNLHCMLCGNRPMVLQKMTLNSFNVAYKNPKKTPAGEEFYLIASDDQQTHGVSYVYMSSEVMGMLMTYVKHVRPTPTPGHSHYLFLNSSGKMLSNPSDHIAILFVKLGIDFGIRFTHTEFRKTITTLGSKFLSPEKQLLLHSMLTHSESTANRDYLEGDAQMVPYQLGVPVLDELLKHCSDTMMEPPRSFLSGSESIGKGLPHNAVVQFMAYVHSVARESDEAAVPQLRSALQWSELLPAPISPLMVSSATARTPPTSASTSRSSSPDSSRSRSALSFVDSVSLKDRIYNTLTEMVDLTADCVIPTKSEVLQFDQDRPVHERIMGKSVATDKETMKAFNTRGIYIRMELRAKEVVAALGRMKDKASIKSAVADYLKQRGWQTTKLEARAVAILERLSRDV